MNHAPVAAYASGGVPLAQAVGAQNTSLSGMQTEPLPLPPESDVGEPVSGEEGWKKAADLLASRRLR